MSWTFLRGMLRDPIAVGSIWPSGPALARQMAEDAAIRSTDLVVELGAGTGPITAALVGRGRSLLALEPDPALAAACRARCPGVDVLEQKAQDLPNILLDRGEAAADRIVSGLPFAIWPDPLQRAVLDAVTRALPDDGVFVTFTYAHSPVLPAGRRFRARLGEAFERVTTSPVVWRNAPPALVYRAERPIRSRTRG
jgi:phosphatidylethanolamine/phosphatidyl-N-methylethanolamine N-methyltransferase